MKGIGSLCAVLVLLGSARASADEGLCNGAYVETQRLERKAQLRAARREAITCGQALCSETVRLHCSEWLERIERALPSVVIVARDVTDRALSDVRVEVDGQLVAERLEGRAIELDPGVHRFRVSHGSTVIEQATLINEGEKHRTLEFAFGERAVPRGAARPAPTVVAEAPSYVPVASYVLAGASAIGLGAFGAFALRGHLAERDLRETCRPRCSDEQIDEVRVSYLIADVALGASLASLAAAVALWYGAPSPPEVRDTVRTTPSPGSLRVAVGPAALSVRGAF